MGISLILLLVFLVPLIAGVVSLSRGKRVQGILLLLVALVPLGVVAFAIASFEGIFGPPGDSALASVYETPLPQTLRVVNHKRDSFGMDPNYWWECTPIDEPYLSAVVQKNKLLRATEKEQPNETTLGWPSWWQHSQVKALPECYFSDTGSGGLRRVWVDRKNNRLFIVFMGT